MLAPLGRDAPVASKILADARIEASICNDLWDLVDELNNGAAAAVITDDALAGADLRSLNAWLGRQPSWSDFPFVVLTRQGGSVERNPNASRLMDILGNVSFLERPFHPTTLVSVVQSALRGRRRQYDARDQLVAVAEAQESLKLALVAGAFGSWDLTLPARLLTVSEQHKANFGRRPDQTFHYADYLAAVHPEDIESVRIASDSAARSGGSFKVTYRVFWPDGSLHWIEETGRGRRAAGVVTSLVGVSMDVTADVIAQRERERLVDELSRERAVLEQRVHERTAALVEANDALKAEMKAKLLAEQQLRQAQKMEVFGQLVGGVAHDFNNLLMVVIANIEIIRRRHAPDPQAQRLLESAKAGAQRGAELTRRMLAFARKQDLNPDNVDTVTLLGEMAGLLERSVGPLIRIEIDARQGLPPIRVDRNQLEMALLNLAVNARDAMADGGTLIIRVRTIEHGEEQEINGLPDGRYVVIEVIDTGHGMDAATLAQAIEPFFSTKGIGKGTGLGLSMVHGLARQSGGAFALRSELHKGTTAQLCLPVASEAAASKPEAVPPAETAPGTGHVLVVDDDELVAAGTTAMLEDLGYRVTEVHSGQSAMSALLGGTRPDLLITDFAMPQMNGAELSTRVRALLPEVPILLVTGYADLRSEEQVDVPKLAKPYTQEQLSAEVQRLLRTHAHSRV